MKWYLKMAVWVCIASAATFVSCDEDKEKDGVVYTVSFDTDGGSPVPSVQKVEEGGMATAPSANPAKAGYAFAFWHLSGATTAYNFQSPVNSNIVLYAKWQVEATAEYWQVTWKLNGGAWSTGDNHETKVLKGGTLAEPNAPVNTGYTFDGWYKEPALTNKIMFPYDVSNVTGDFTLYAKWTKEGSSTDPEGEKTFTTISALKAWLASRPDNTAEKAYKVVLKDVNLDSGNNWNDLGAAVGKDNKAKYVHVDLRGCTGRTIPDGRKEQTGSTVTYYGVFVDCDNLISITLPAGLTAIGNYAFYECDGLASFNFPEGLQKIGEGAFGSSGLTSVVIPEGITAISDYAFYSCNSLSSATLPKGLQSIGKYAFYSNDRLAAMTIPAGVKSIGGAAFAFCGRLKEIIVLPVTPPAIIIEREVNILTRSYITSIKVPAASVEAYKTTYGWIYYEDKIVAKTD